jgi:hypothetical protein
MRILPAILRYANFPRSRSAATVFEQIGIPMPVSRSAASRSE